jgi:hypothetical protein
VGLVQINIKKSKGVCKNSDMPPTTLDRLYRFSRHDEVSHGSPGITWVVSAGSLEQSARMYRYAYTHPNGSHVEREVSISLERSLKKHEKADLITMFMDLRRFTRDDTFAPYFRLACLDLLREDPWFVFIRESVDAGAK